MLGDDRFHILATFSDKRRKHRQRQRVIPLAERAAHTPAEFAGLFGRSETWGYRQLYSGRVKAIQVSGRLLIPRSEVDRLLAEAAVYTGVPERAPHRVVNQLPPVASLVGIRCRWRDRGLSGLTPTTGI